jgi:hypothetical protein
VATRRSTRVHPWLVGGAAVLAWWGWGAAQMMRRAWCGGRPRMRAVPERTGYGLQATGYGLPAPVATARSRYPMRLRLWLRLRLRFRMRLRSGCGSADGRMRAWCRSLSLCCVDSGTGGG